MDQGFLVKSFCQELVVFKSNTKVVLNVISIYCMTQKRS